MSLRDLVKIDMAGIKKALPEYSGNLDATPKDRIRLLRLLKNKYGRGFRMFPEASEALKHFDGEREEIIKLMKIKEGISNAKR
jgi:hypothetical protein